MKVTVSSNLRETQDITRALRRAARRALELGLKSGTPVYVVENGKIVDLTKRNAPATKTSGTKASSTKPKTTKTAKPTPRRSSR